MSEIVVEMSKTAQEALCIALRDYPEYFVNNEDQHIALLSKKCPWSRAFLKWATKNQCLYLFRVIYWEETTNKQRQLFLSMRMLGFPSICFGTRIDTGTYFISPKIRSGMHEIGRLTVVPDVPALALATKQLAGRLPTLKLNKILY